MNYEKLKEFVEDNGFTSRKQRYEIYEKLYGVSAETCKKIISTDRTLRDIFPVDKRGIELEKEWHATPSFWGAKVKLDKKLQDDLLKYS